MEEPLVNPKHLKIKPQKKSNTYEKMDLYIVTLRLSRFFEGIYKDFKQIDKYGIAKDMRDYLTNIQTYLMILNDFDNEEKLNIMLKTKIEIAKFGAKLNISKDNKVFKSFKQWKCVPEDKTLFNSNDFKGIPIGNLTSQFFANVYLNELDKFVKHTLKVKYYIRYVDDFILMSKDKNELWKLFRMIEEFLNDKLHLKMKKHPKLALLSSGINFVGYVQHIHYRLVRRRVANNFKERLKDFEYDSEDSLIKLRESINSYFSYFNSADGHRELLEIFRNNLWLSEYFMVGKKKVWIY